MEQSFTSGGSPGANAAEVVARKAGESLKSNETWIVREWIKGIIDDLGLLSLKEFPSGELAGSLPGMIQAIARAVSDPGEDLAGNADLQDVAARLAALRREEPAVAKLIDDLSLLKKVILAAAATDLRRSDLAVLDVVQNLDDGFRHLFKTGIEAYFERHSEELQRQADTDALTGLYNVRFFRHQLHRNLEMYKRYRIPFSLLMVDLDKLKQLNDVRGHVAGDLALKHLANIMTGEKRETDVAVRYGGDEFFLLAPGTTAEDAERLARRIIDRVKALNLSTSGREMTGASIGVVWCPGDGTDVGTLRAKADRALYLAKSIGGAAVAHYVEFSVQPQIVF